MNPHSGNNTNDIAVIKLNSAGVLQWHTFHGYTGLDEGTAIAVDGSGNVYVAGRSRGSWGSPVNPHSNSSDDIVVLKLNSNGYLQWNTFHGTTDRDIAYGLALDVNGNVYVTGLSYYNWGSPVNPHPQLGGDDSIVVLKLDNAGTLQWNTFHGGNSSYHIGRGIAVDGDGYVYIAGEAGKAWGTPVNSFNDGFDIIVLKLNNSGALQWHTFHGSAYYDFGTAIALDGGGNIYVTGYSYTNWGSPVNPFQGTTDAFVLKLDNAGVLQWNTFHGSSSGSDSGYGIALDSGGNVFVTGNSNQDWGNADHSHNGANDIFVLKLNNGGELQWHTFYGSGSSDIGFGIASTSENVYVTGFSSGSWGNPVSSYSGGQDIGVIKFADAASRTMTVTKTGSGDGTVTAGANCTLSWVDKIGSCTVNEGTSITLSGSASAGSTFGGWSNGSGSASGCSGTGSCTFSLTADSEVTSTFNGSAFNAMPWLMLLLEN